MDVFDLLHDVSMLKKTEHFPTAEQIYKWTYGAYRGLTTSFAYMCPYIGTIQYRFCGNVAESLDIVSAVNAYDTACENYFRWLAAELSETGIVSMPKVDEKMREYGITRR